MGKNNAISNLLIVDDEYINQSTEFQIIANEAEEKLKEFISVISTMKSDLVIEGHTAETLVEFCTKLGSALASNLSLITLNYSQLMRNYIEEIDIADQFLFGED